MIQNDITAISPSPESQSAAKVFPGSSGGKFVQTIVALTQALQAQIARIRHSGSGLIILRR